MILLSGNMPGTLRDFATIQGTLRVDGNKKGLFTRGEKTEAGGTLFQTPLAFGKIA